jgi:hypothetical protein
MSKLLIAWVWASGLIEFGVLTPEGAVEFAYGPEPHLKEIVTALAREGQGRSAGKLLVPGIPEASTPETKVDALEAWLNWAAKGNGKTYMHGVRFRGAA